MGGGVAEGLPPVVPPHDDLALAHHHGPYRHLPGLEGALGLFQRLAEEVVMVVVHAWLSVSSSSRHLMVVTTTPVVPSHPF